MPCGSEKCMPCGSEYAATCEEPQNVKYLIDKLETGKWFGFAEVDIQAAEELREKFSERSALFLNREILEDVVPDKW